MKKEIIKTSRYLLVVDDSKITNDDWFIPIGGFGWEINKPKQASKLDGYHNEHCKKLIAYLPLNDAPILEGVPLLPPIENEAETLAFRHTNPLTDYLSAKEFNCMKEGFESGYNKAKQSERNNLTPFKNLIILIENGLLKGTVETNLIIDQEISICKEYLNKLSQPKTPTHFEFTTFNRCWCMKPMNGGCPECRIEVITTTNAQGQEIACGKYICE